MYLTHDEYLDFGGTESMAHFLPLELKARKQIDRLTAGRVGRMEKVPEAVKLCLFALIEIEEKAGLKAQIENPVVTSVSTDGYSESYGKAMGAADVVQSQNKMIREMLYGELDDDGIPLLYRGLVL